MVMSWFESLNMFSSLQPCQDGSNKCWFEADAIATCLRIDRQPAAAAQSGCASHVEGFCWTMWHGRTTTNSLQMTVKNKHLIVSEVKSSITTSLFQGNCFKVFCQSDSVQQFLMVVPHGLMVVNFVNGDLWPGEVCSQKKPENNSGVVHVFSKEISELSTLSKHPGRKDPNSDVQLMHFKLCDRKFGECV